MEKGSFATIRPECKENGTWVLTIDRPNVLNALSSEVLNEMAIFFRQVQEMSYQDARALIITGAGEKAFVAGADIREISKLNEVEGLEFARRGQHVFRELGFLKIPVIAAVNGFALGGGCELALACDFIFASENAKFGLPEVGLGLIPGFGGTVNLPRAVGLRKAKEWIFSGRMISAGEAKEMGIVNRVCASSELLSQAMAVAGEILTKSPLAVARAKSSILQGWDMDLDVALENEATLFADICASQDMKEGTQAFLEKRKSEFRGL